MKKRAFPAYRTVFVLVVAIFVSCAGFSASADAANPPVIAPSSPATVKSNAKTLTTASFTPPAGSVLYIAVALNSNNDNKVTSITDNLATHLVYTKSLSQGSELGNDTIVYLYTAPVAVSKAMTVSVAQQSNSSSRYAFLKVLVATGASTSTPVGAKGGGRGATGPISDSYASTVPNSLGWLIYGDWAQKGVPTAGSGKSVYDSYNVSGEISYALINQAAATPAVGTTVTLNTTAPSSGAQIAHLYFEMVPSAQIATTTATTTPPADITPPTVSSFTIPATSSSLTIPISSLTATDNVGVTGYMVTESSTAPVSGAAGWSAMVPSSFTFASAGAKTLYAWAKDVAGNVSQSRSAGVTITLSPSANLTVDGSIISGLEDGIGSNVQSWSWKKGEIIPALDALVDTLGHSAFRVIHDRMEWAGTGSTRPAATLAGLRSLDPAVLQTVYESPDMQDMWSTIGYLNSKGVTGDQIITSFMGWTAPWMGGSGAYGVSSTIIDDALTDQDIATMIASFVYYGHHRRDVSGSNQNLSFNYVAPFNESDWNGLEGPTLTPSQLNTIYADISNTLTAMGDTATKIAGPDTANSPDSYTAALGTSALARMSDLSWHSYSGNAVGLAASRSGVLADWMTETSVWCSGCDANQPPSQSEWSFGSGIGDLILGDLLNGYSRVLTWEAFDTFYYHHNSYSAWGHIACTQGGVGCTTSDSLPRTYSIRARAWPEATIAQGVRPGMSMIGVKSSLSGVVSAAFNDSAQNVFSLIGHNSNTSTANMSIQLNSLANVQNSTLHTYFTNQSMNLQPQADVTAASGAFNVSVPADTFFLITNRALGAVVAPPTQYAINASAGSGGSVSPSGTVFVPTGGSQTFVFSANSGYQLGQALVDGLPVSLSNGAYTFTNVTAAHALTASFSSTATNTAALAIDPSSPATVKDNSQTLTTASFTPPAGSVLYIAVALNSNNDNKVTSITDNLATHLVYTKSLSQGSELGNDTIVYLYTAPVAVSKAMTVSVAQQSNSSSRYAFLKVLVATGASTSTPVGAKGGGRGATGPISDSYASTVPNSLGWLIYGDWAQKGVPTAGSGKSVYDSYNVSGEISYALINQAAATPAVGTSVTMNTTAPSSGAQIAHLYFEMVPSAQ